MILYILNFLLIPCYSFLFKNNKKIFCYVTCIQLFLILALRDPLFGPDVGGYSTGFNYIGTFSFKELLSRLHVLGDATLKYPYKYESGWTLLNWIFYQTGLNYTAFSIFCSFINILSFGLFIYKYSDDPELSFLLFLSFSFFEYCFYILRQSLAVSLLLFATDSILEKKYIKSIIIFIIACTLHKTALLFFPMLFINVFTHTKPRFIVVIFLLLLEVLIVKYFFPTIALVLALLGKDYISTKFSLNNLFILLWCIVFATYIFFDRIKLEKKNNFAIWGVLLALAIETVGLAQDVVARAVEIGLVYIFILIPVLFEVAFKKKMLRLEIRELFKLFLFVFMIYNTKGSYIEPYTSIF